MKWKYQQLTACHHFSANLFKLQKIGEVVTEGLQKITNWSHTAGPSKESPAVNQFSLDLLSNLPETFVNASEISDKERNFPAKR